MDYSNQVEQVLREVLGFCVVVDSVCFAIRSYCYTCFPLTVAAYTFQYAMSLYFHMITSDVLQMLQWSATFMSCTQLEVKYTASEKIDIRNEIGIRQQQL